MFVRMLLGAAMMMVTGCATVPPAGEEDDVRTIEDPNYVCKAEPAQHLVGRTATTELGAEARRLAGAKSLRWIPKDGAVTMDYRPDRLNIELDERNRITRIRCG